jgi:hypothetical protein
MSIARHVGLVAPVAVWLLVATAPRAALAQAGDKGPTKAERASARDAYDKGTTAFAHGDYVTALDSFVKANAVIPSVQAMYWIAQAQDKLGHSDAAIEAYEAITSRADYSKLSEDKAGVVRDRLAALKAAAAPPPPPASPPAAEPPPPPAAEPPPPVATLPSPPIDEPPPRPETDVVLPARNTAELGVLGGAMFVSSTHGLVKAGHTQREFDGPAWQVGLRAAFFPEKVFGVEGEYAHGFGSAKDSGGSAGGNAKFDVIRGHLIGQLPTSRVVPFALLGAGLLHGNSKPNGADNDFLLEAGIGLKVMATKLLVPRLDFRLNATQKKGGGFSDGLAISPEVLLGLSFTLGR